MTTMKIFLFFRWQMSNANEFILFKVDKSNVTRKCRPHKERGGEGTRWMIAIWFRFYFAHNDTKHPTLEHNEMWFITNFFGFDWPHQLFVFDNNIEQIENWPHSCAHTRLLEWKTVEARWQSMTFPWQLCFEILIDYKFYWLCNYLNF